MSCAARPDARYKMSEGGAGGGYGTNYSCDARNRSWKLAVEAYEIDSCASSPKLQISAKIRLNHIETVMIFYKGERWWKSRRVAEDPWLPNPSRPFSTYFNQNKIEHYQ